MDGGMWRFRGPAALVALVAVLAAGCGVFGDGRSVEAYCETWRTGSMEIVDRLEGVSFDEEGGDPLAALGALIRTPGDLVSLFDELADVAPEDIQREVEAVRDSLDQSIDAGGEAVSDPVAGLASGFVAAIKSAGAYEKVGTYTAENCGMPPYE